MTNLPYPVVTQGAFLTLHYRLASLDGVEMICTFDGNPATLMLGQGQLAPFLEDCLIGLPEGAHTIFELQSEKAFGSRNPELIRRVSRLTLEQNSAFDAEYKIGDLVDFAAPGGGRFAGILRELDEQGAVFDFNHPLAGQPVRFEVKIIGIL